PRLRRRSIRPGMCWTPGTIFRHDDLVNRRSSKCDVWIVRKLLLLNRCIAINLLDAHVALDRLADVPKLPAEPAEEAAAWEFLRHSATHPELAFGATTVVNRHRFRTRS